MHKNFLLTLPNVKKSADRADSAVAMSSSCWSPCATPNPGRMRSTFTIFSNGSIILPGFKFMELHALTLAARPYGVSLIAGMEYGMDGGMENGKEL